jgi:hypothetical protein
MSLKSPFDRKGCPIGFRSICNRRGLMTEVLYGVSPEGQSGGQRTLPKFCGFPNAAGDPDEHSRLKIRSPTPRPLIGQKALVTGANSGIGRTVAIDLGQAGADVVVNYVAGEDRAQEVPRTIEQHGVKAYAHLADVSNEAQVRDMFSYDGEAAGYDRHPRQQCRTAM